MKKLLTSILLVLSFSQAHANRTGNELLQNLRKPTEDYLQGVAHGLIVGTATTRPDICPPAAVTNGQLIDVVRNFLEAAPSMRHLSTMILIHGALIHAFPCPAQKGLIL
jgi:hypothetical protein